MGRFFFDLQGAQNAKDPTGLAFETELDAFRAAQRLAWELSRTRPNLRGSTCVVVTLKGGGDLLRERVRPVWWAIILVPQCGTAKSMGVARNRTNDLFGRGLAIRYYPGRGS